jgi:hypothetical protein
VVLDDFKARRGRPPKPSDDEDYRLDLLAHRSEEQAAHETVLPLLRRLELIAQLHGPAAWQTVAAVSSWHQRHARRWADEGDAA